MTDIGRSDKTAQVVVVVEKFVVGLAKMIAAAHSVVVVEMAVATDIGC